MSTNYYNIDHTKLTKLLLPPLFRKAKLVQLLIAYIEPLRVQWQAFTSYRQAVTYRLAHGSQVCYMRGMLNDNFDPTLRRIFIKTSVVQEPNWLYRDADNFPGYVYREADSAPKKYIYREADFSLYRPDFTVFIPEALRPTTTVAYDNFISKITGLINSYKLYSKNYNIEWIN